MKDYFNGGFAFIRNSTKQVTEDTRLVEKERHKYNCSNCGHSLAKIFIIGESHPLRNYLGVILGVLSGINFSICTLCVKLLTNVPTNHLAIVRHILTASFALPLAVYCGASFRLDLKNSTFVFGRMFFDTSGVLLMFSTIQRVSIEESTVIIFSSPALISLLGRIFLKEKCSWTLTLSIVVMIFGVCLVVKLPYHILEKDSWQYSEIEGIVYGVFSIMCVSSFYVFSSLLREEKVEVIMWHTSWLSVLFTLVIATLLGEDFNTDYLLASDVRVMLLMGVVSFLGQFFLINALKVENSGIVAIARAVSDILCVFVFDFVFFEAKVDALNISGAVLVLFGGAIINLSKWLGGLPDDSRLKNKLKLFIT